MAPPLHILVLGSTPHVPEWRAAGHRVTEVAAGRLRAAWRTWRGAGRDADVVVEVVGRRAYLTPLWGWLEAPRVVADGKRPCAAARFYRPLLYGDTPVVADPTLALLQEAAGRERVRVR